MISKNEAISQFRQIIGQKAAWLLLMGSQFIEHLGVFVSWCLRDALWKIERLYQEFFISTALNRSSIMAHVEDRNYLPIKRLPSTGIARITNNGPNSFFLPANTPFESEAIINYATTDSATIASGQHADVPVSQILIDEIEFTITTEQKFYQYLFTKEQTISLTSFEVYLDINNGLGFVQWQYAPMFMNSEGTDTVYDEFYSHTEQTGIRFGNGLFGMVPPLNSKVKIKLAKTEGVTSLLVGQKLNLVGAHLDNGTPAVDVDLSAVVYDPSLTGRGIVGGSSEEGTEEIRTNLHYWPTYDNKLVWDDDYRFFITRNILGIVWFKCWGEQQQEAVSGFDVLNINKIFLTGYKPGTTNAALKTAVEALCGYIPLLNRHFVWVDPAFSAFTVTISGKVSREVSIDTAEAAIETALLEKYGKDSTARTTDVNVSDIYDLVRRTGYFNVPKTSYLASVSGTVVPTALNEMVHIDMITTTVTLSYNDVG